MPSSIRRIAVLPMAFHSSISTMGDSAGQLSRVVEAELRKTQLFEIVHVSAEQLQRWTGRPAWRADEALPTNLLAFLHVETACDGVVFPTLTEFRPYPPLAVGLDLRLIDIMSGQVLWAVDEVIDSGEASVVRAAKDYSESRLHGGNRPDDTTVLQSPRQFGQYAAATLVATLPRR